jgi:hypothetical protein
MKGERFEHEECQARKIKTARSSSGEYLQSIHSSSTVQRRVARTRQLKAKTKPIFSVGEEEEEEVLCFCNSATIHR